MSPPLRAPSGLPPEAFAAALSDLPGMGPARLVALLREHGPEHLWRAVCAGQIKRPPPPKGKSPVEPVPWAVAASRRDLASSWRSIEGKGIGVAYFGGPGFPVALASDAEPPGVLFWAGSLEAALARPRVAIVGTRQATGYGRAIAAQLGRDLSAAGVCVVSGLALGIDGAAHEGALLAVGGAKPLGVAASGVDCPYPARHSSLWRSVITAGALISETPPGRPAQAWRFPARNRLIAALAQAVVVVESHEAGGSMLTVAAAIDRGVDVLAVPGPVTSPSSLGTNHLLYEGVAPARHAGDVLAALGDLRPWPPATSRAAPAASSSRRSAGASAGRPAATQPARPVAPAAHQGRARTGNAAALFPAACSEPLAGLDPAARRTLEAVDRTPTPTSVVAERTGIALGALSRVLIDLEARQLIQGQGLWWERCDQR